MDYELYQVVRSQGHIYAFSLNTSWVCMTYPQISDLCLCSAQLIIKNTWGSTLLNLCFSPLVQTVLLVCQNYELHSIHNNSTVQWLHSPSSSSSSSSSLLKVITGFFDLRDLWGVTKLSSPWLETEGFVWPVSKMYCVFLKVYFVANHHFCNQQVKGQWKVNSKGTDLSWSSHGL